MSDREILNYLQSLLDAKTDIPWPCDFYIGNCGTTLRPGDNLREKLTTAVVEHAKRHVTKTLKS